MTDLDYKLIVRYLTGEVSDYEQEKLKEWLNEGENRIQYEEFKLIWMTSGELYRNYSPDLGRARGRIQNGIDNATAKLTPWKWIGRVAAILVAAVGIIWTIAEYSATRDFRQLSMEEISTGSAIDSVALSDGSTVWLNRRTTLKFPSSFTGHERRVFLSGEAFFKVYYNAEKPFIVETRGTVTRVLGTSFNIKSGKDNVSVAVRTGKVLFSEHDDSKNCELLVKNEMAAFSYANRSIQKSIIDSSDIPAWRSHLLVFKNSPLSEVVEKISAYYDTSIHLDPAIPGNLSLTTSFEDQSVEDVLEVVCATLDLKLENTSDGYLLVRTKE